jgi:hypothetical protein
VFTAQYAPSPYIKQIRFVFKGSSLLFFNKASGDTVNKFDGSATEVIKLETHFYSVSIHKLCISIQVGDSIFF